MTYNYDELLDRARSQLPKEIFEHKRFDVPDVEMITVGKRTIIRNFGDLADAFNRNANHMMKYLTRELATAGDIEGRRAVFQGRFPDEKIVNRINEYSKEYVYCHECGKPDTHIIKQGRIHMLKCEACGARSSIRAY
jgi:translation initiation factor 2 subunit 2